MRSLLHAGWFAALTLCVTLAAFDLASGMATQPVSAYGSIGALAAQTWNLYGFVTPGLLLAVFALALETPMRAHGARRGGRIGTNLLLLAGLFFAAQGALPYDPTEPDQRASQWHVAMLSLQWFAFLPGALLIAASLWRARAWWMLTRIGTLLVLLLTLGVLAWPEPVTRIAPGILQRLMLGCEFGWFALASFSALRVSRAAQSTG